MLNEALLESEDSETLNTSFIERLSLTIRQGSAPSPCLFEAVRISVYVRPTEFAAAELPTIFRLHGEVVEILDELV